MSAIPPIASIGASSPAAEIDAFRSAMNSAGQALGADPNAIGRAITGGIENFRAEEVAFRQAAGTAIDTGKAEIDFGDPASSHPSDAMSPDLASETATGTGDSMRQTQQRSVGLMMQTYSFALEATLVGNAATTFTNSINTLIKTQ